MKTLILTFSLFSLFSAAQVQKVKSEMDRLEQMYKQELQKNEKEIIQEVSKIAPAPKRVIKAKMTKKLKLEQYFSQF